MARLLPREGKFFELFNQHADLAAAAAVELQIIKLKEAYQLLESITAKCEDVGGS